MSDPMRIIRGAAIIASLLAAEAAAEPGGPELSALAGQVSLTSASGGSVTALRGARVEPGAVIATGAESSAVLVFPDGSKLRIGPLSRFRVDEAGSARVSVYLLKGALDCWWRRVAGRRAHVRTPAAVAAVRGTVFSVRSDERGSRFDLFSGELAVTDALGRGAIITGGQRAEALADGSPRVSSLPPGSRAPAEPAVALVSVPPAAASAEEPEPEELAAPPPPSEDRGALTTSSPTQEAAAVSPSSP